MGFLYSLIFPQILAARVGVEGLEDFCAKNQGHFDEAEDSHCTH